MTEPATRASDLERSIRDALTEEGIDSLDALVSRLASSSAARHHDEDQLLMVAAASWRSHSDSEPPEPHRPPEMILVVDGERHEPSQITEFDGRPLYSTPGINATGDPVLYGFTTMTGLNDHLTSAPHDDIGTTNPDSLSPIARYFEHADEQGDRLENNPGRAWRDLVRVPRGFLGVGNWNDIISSVDWCRWDISLYEHTNYGGSQLYLRAGRTYNHLTDFGWNDRASATVNWGTRF